MLRAYLNAQFRAHENNNFSLIIVSRFSERSACFGFDKSRFFLNTFTLLVKFLGVDEDKLGKVKELIFAFRLCIALEKFWS